VSATLPISRLVTVAEVPDKGADFTITATPEQLPALAMALKLPAVSSFEARVHVRPFGREGLGVSGTVLADITQTCVVTLDPFDSHVEADIDLELTPPHDERHQRRYPQEDSNEDVAGRGADLDAPDPLVDGAVDIAAVAVEFLALSLDLHPRKPGAAFSGHEEDAGHASPFAGLGRMLQGDRGQEGQ
jgi:hypothetical protein